MKLHLSVALAAVLIAGTVSAQSVNIGIKGGLNLYNINNSAGTSGDVKPGFHIGALGHIHLARQLALQPEVIFSTQGSKSSANSVDYKQNLSYINVPVLFQYMFDNGFRLQAGPQVGFLLSAKSELGNNPSQDNKNLFKPIDLGLSAGVGYVHPPTGFGVDARYNLGLSDIYDNNTSSVTSTNRGVQLGVFYLFNHKN